MFNTTSLFNYETTRQQEFLEFTKAKKHSKNNK
jgi:hypothetical protein